MPRTTAAARPTGATPGGLLSQDWLDSHSGSPLLSPSNVAHRISPRSMRSKLTWLTVFALIFVFLVFRQSSFPAGKAAFSENPTEPQTSLSEDGPPPIARPSPTTGSQDDSGGSSGGRGSGSSKDNHPAFHLLIRRRPRQSSGNPDLCRTMFTSMVLDYPPATLIEGAPGNKSINAIHDYLSKPLRFKDEDVVLIIDEPDVWFQLPSELLLRRFFDLLAQDNKKLRSRYGSLASTEDGRTTQVFSERIIFGADKVCHSKRADDPGCTAVPFSPLMPDVYGKYTDDSADPSKYRPRWLNSGAVMGLVGDVRLLYGRAAELSHETGGRFDEQQILSTIFGQQEYARELYRLLVSRGWATRFAEAVGILDAVDISNVNSTFIKGQRYEFAVGLDYRSDLFFTIPHAENDIEWLRYNNVSEVSDAQRNHMVPRESRLLLPDDIEDLPNPFTEMFNDTDTTQSKKASASTSPGYKKSIDKLPSTRNESWETVPLATNVRSATVPAVLRLDRKPRELDDMWGLMWFHPWPRALLRKYLRSIQEEDVSISSLQNGDNSWDTRGGKGGMWTTDDEWKTWPEMCKGFEEEVFGDGLGAWGKEYGYNRDGPVYNQWGLLLSGEEGSN